MFKINPDEVRKISFLPYLDKHYKDITKRQLYDMTTGYIRAAYMRNGNAHVISTLDMLKKYEE